MKMSKALHILLLLGIHASGKAQQITIPKVTPVSFVATPLSIAYFPYDEDQKFEVVDKNDSISFRYIYIERKFLKRIKLEPYTTYKITGYISIKTESDMNSWGRNKIISHVYVKPDLTSILIRKHLEPIN